MPSPTCHVPLPAPRRPFGPPPFDPGGRGRLQCRVAADIAAAFLAVPAADILSPLRSHAAASHARHVSMYLAHVAFQLTLTAVAMGFGRDRTSVSYAVARIEDERDDGDFDRLLTRMELLSQSCRRLAIPGAVDDGEGH